MRKKKDNIDKKDKHDRNEGETMELDTMNIDINSLKVNNPFIVR